MKFKFGLLVVEFLVLILIGFLCFRLILPICGCFCFGMLGLHLDDSVFAVLGFCRKTDLISLRHFLIFFLAHSFSYKCCKSMKVKMSLVLGI